MPSVTINNQNFEKLFFGLLVVQSILNQPRMFLEKLIKKFLCELNLLYEKAKQDEVHMH